MDLCADCRAELPTIDPCCPSCARPLPVGTASNSICRTCQHQPPLFHRCRAALRYQTPVKELVGDLKFRAQMNMIRLAGQLMAEQLHHQPDWQRPDAIIPVPMHPQRLRERGYNQALELARVVSHRLAVPLDGTSISRVRLTTPQTKLKRRERLSNLHGSFAARRRLDGLRVALLDDVMTTGSTVTECTQVVLAAGAAEVEVWVLARTVEPERSTGDLRPGE